MLKLLTPEWYAPPSGDGAEFEIRGLNYREWLVAVALEEERNATKDRVEATTLLADLMLHTLQNGVSGWRNMSAEFSPDLLIELPDAVINDLTAKILERSRLARGQEKNSSSPSTSRRREKPSTAPTAGSTAPAKKKATNSRASAGA